MGHFRPFFGEIRFSSGHFRVEIEISAKIAHFGDFWPIFSAVPVTVWGPSGSREEHFNGHFSGQNGREK